MDSPLFANVSSPIPRWMGGVFGREGLGERESQSLGYAFAIRRIGAVAVADMALLDEELRIAHCSCRILARGSLVLGCHQAPQLTGLCVVVAIELTLIVVIDLAINLQRWLFHCGRILPLAVAIRLIRYGAPSIVVRTHLTIAVVGVVWAARTIYGDKVVVYTEAVALGITIGE